VKYFAQERDLALREDSTLELWGKGPLKGKQNVLAEPCQPFL